MNTTRQNDADVDGETINDLVQSGRLNESYAKASQQIPFFLENLFFMKLIFDTLYQLGLFDAAKEVNSYINRYSNYRKSAKDKYNSDIVEAKTLGHSNGYKLQGTHTQGSNPYWENRAKLIAEIIPTNETILDLGCGNMLLERFLRDPKGYIPCDLQARDYRTVVCDFEKLEYPEIGRETIVVCLGVVNYLCHQKELVENICARQRPFYLSFKPQELIKSKVEAGVFPSALSFKDMLLIFESHGYSARYKYLLGQGDEILFIGSPRS